MLTCKVSDSNFYCDGKIRNNMGELPNAYIVSTVLGFKLRVGDGVMVCYECTATNNG